MNWDIAQRTWPQFQNEVRANWSKLGDSELADIAGKRPQLISTIITAYGLTQDEAEQQIRSFEARDPYGRQVSSR